MIDQPSGSGRTWSLVSAQYQVAARLLHPQDRFDCARSVLRDSAAFRRLMGVVHVHEEDALAARHPQSHPARVAVTLRSGLTADYLSDGRSPSLDWHWDPLLTKARAVAVRVGAPGTHRPAARGHHRLLRFRPVHEGCAARSVTRLLL